MLEQIHAPSEDGRKVQIMVSLATTAYGVFTTATSGLVLPPAAAMGAAVAVLGCATLASVTRRATA
jgi:hypothetical protein